MERTVAVRPDKDEGLYTNQLVDEILGKFLDQHELALLLKYSQIDSFKPGETFLCQGQNIEGIYLILEGIVLVNAIIMGQGNTRLETLFPGQFLSTISFIEHSPCHTSFLATDTVLCLFIPNTYFQRLANDYPETKYKLMRVIMGQICARLKTIHDIVASFISESEMTSLSFFERVLYSLNQPKKLSVAESGFDLELLQKSPLFKSFTKDDYDALLTYFELLDAPKNCKLINENEKNASCYLVMYGGIQTCIIQDGKHAKLSVIGPGTLLASIGCIDTASAFNITYITCEHTVLFKLSVTSLQLIKENRPDLWYKLFELICGSLTALKKSIDKLNIRLHTETYNR
ncbi:Crp/Fnr family transcriptional regulator [Legionella bononiensis]|uniref:Cyclic nucleotide-binding domain-containing protein n=1 Tax=Legionella bononiensis TaxID=2793102 RepID=A0ABS1WB84_9GAMM|nr:cyclic nucleotide-binding domain-containing protein [Legionella bononiensis]MBL7481520.1 cyclic nucleotide-binding domain-containing protein [Legionella bononiensis]MBL7526612.1 cyclic nucleotide-binding domain-containing protein [Legionella bononiensis]